MLIQIFPMDMFIIFDWSTEGPLSDTPSNMVSKAFKSSSVTQVDS